MAHHVWSVLCTKGVVDQESKQVSLFDVVEKLTISTTRERLEQDLEAAQAEEKVPLMTHPMQIVSWWVRSDYAVPEEGAMRLRVFSPSGEGPIAGPFRIDLREHSGFRFTVKNPNIPLHDAQDLGRYWWFVVEGQTGHGEEDWESVARIPLKVELQEQVEA